MPRAIWSGTIGFGLVSVPARIYSAIDEKDVRFHLLHEKDDSRIGFEKICKREDKPVPDDEIVKGYEVADGKYVHLTDEDFEAAEGEAYKTIDISDFVPYDEIDPIYFERTYYLGPGRGGEKVYALLVRAMEQAGLVGIAKYVMREKQQLGCLRTRDGTLLLEKMYFADEVRAVDGIKPKRASVTKRELEMARELIDRFSGHFEIDKYEDTHRKALLRVIEAKRKSKEIHVERRREEEEPPDLMEALRASIGSARRRRQTGSLSELTKQQLTRRAKREGISGYSKMSKNELVDVLSSAA